MKKELFRVEVGVLLNKEHPEFKAYNNVYTKDFGFYDEDIAVYSSFEEAEKYGLQYIKDGVNNTYAVITSDVLDNDSEDDKKIISDLIAGEIYPDKSTFGFKESDIVYFAFKEAGEDVIKCKK